MTSPKPAAGYFLNGPPYNRTGRGPHPLVVFQGLMFENKPLPASMARFMGYGFLEEAYTIYLVGRKPGLPDGYSLGDMADDYATLIREEFGGPVDVLGVSTGGSLAQQFAADHPDLVRRLVIHSAAHTLGAAGKAIQWRMGVLARQGKWRAMFTEFGDFMVPRTGIKGLLGKLTVRLLVPILTPLMRPKDLRDLVVTVEAEDKFAFKDRLHNIAAPTLVAAGENDPFYTPALFQETAAGIPNARLALYVGVGHPAAGKPFQQDVRAFLLEG